MPLTISLKTTSCGTAIRKCRRATGGGNVIAYNYMDDAFGKDTQRAGGRRQRWPLHDPTHGTGGRELSSNYKGDTYWGNSIYITVFRNWLTGLRAAHPPLNTYTYSSGGCTYPYGDFTGRTAVDVQAYSYNQNFAGNVLGMSNQQLLSNNNLCYVGVESEFLAQVLTTADNNAANSANAAIMWNFGSYQATVNTSCGCWTWVDTTINTQLRNGNFDWVTKAQHWYGIGGTTDGAVQPMPIPNRFTSQPSRLSLVPTPGLGSIHRRDDLYAARQSAVRCWNAELAVISPDTAACYD